MASQPARREIGNYGPLDTRKHTIQYDAPGLDHFKDAFVEFSDDLKELQCDGIVLDVIDGLGSLKGCDPRCDHAPCKQSSHALVRSTQAKNVSGRNDSTSPDGEADSKCSTLLEAISRCLSIDRKDKFLTTKAPEEYIIDFQMLFQAYINQKPDLDPLFSSWLQDNSSLLFGGHRLIDVIRSGTSDSIASSSTPDGAVKDVDEFDQSADVNFNTFLSRFSYVTRQMARRIIVTNDVIIGMAPCRARKGDVVVILCRCSIPVILRPIETGKAYQIVGEAYVHGYMNGEIKEELIDGIRQTKRLRLV